MNTVENLKKVTLQLQAGTEADNLNLELPACHYAFIFGIGPDGMCPFEYQLIGRRQDEVILLHLNKEDMSRFWGHLRPPIPDLFEENKSVCLKVKILKLEQPESKEVIKALAELASHPGGCDCGCGC